MKSKLLMLIVGIGLLLGSCGKKEEEDIIVEDNPNDVSGSSVTTTISGGNWKVTYFWDTDHDETSDFAGYKFTFAGGGKLNAIKGQDSESGTWGIGTDNSKTKLIISFPAGGNLDDLNEDWEVVERTKARVKLQHISGGGGGTDFLTFEKN
jgi:hypothetical protein